MENNIKEQALIVKERLSYYFKNIDGSWYIDKSLPHMDEFLNEVDKLCNNIIYGNNNVDRILLIAKKILDLNPDAFLTGSLMLYIRGYNLNREPKDIDILINNYADRLIFPEDVDVESTTMGSFKTSDSFIVDGIKVEVLSQKEEFDIINGFRVAKIDELVFAKILYYKNNDKTSKKHYDDLILMGYDDKKIDEIYLKSREDDYTFY